MTQEEQLQKGFNAGFKMQHLDAKLAETMQQSMKGNDHPYAQGFIKGREEFSKELAQDKSNYKSQYFERLSDSSASQSLEQSIDLNKEQARLDRDNTPTRDEVTRERDDFEIDL